MERCSEAAARGFGHGLARVGRTRLSAPATRSASSGTVSTLLWGPHDARSSSAGRSIWCCHGHAGGSACTGDTHGSVRRGETDVRALRSVLEGVGCRNQKTERKGKEEREQERSDRKERDVRFRACRFHPSAVPRGGAP
jgi:hypothetical protein